jgi:hypothetical protein
MTKEIEPAGKKEVVEPHILQVYETLPPPQNNEQYSEYLAWLDRDRERVFTYAKSSDTNRYIFKSLVLIAGMIMMLAASERVEAIKWFLKLLSPFLK